MSQSMTKSTKWPVCPAKAQISLGICPVLSESLPSSWRSFGSLATHKAHNEDSVGRTCHSVCFVVLLLISEETPWNCSLVRHFIITYFFFYLDFMAHQDYLTHLGPKQSLGGANMGDPREKPPDHMWPKLGSNPQWWDDKRFRALKISILNHLAMGAAYSHINIKDSWHISNLRDF